MNIISTVSFRKRYDSLPVNIKDLAKSKELLFKEYPFHMGLKTHKLHGDMKDKWAFSLNYKFRIVFKFVDDQTACFIDIGTHDVYD